MGNCLKHPSSSSVVWAGDDWGSVQGHRSHHEPFRKDENDGCSSSTTTTTTNVERQKLLSEIRRSCLSSSPPSSLSSLSSPSTREVKIKITKRELEELMGRAERQRLSVEQVILSGLMDASDQHEVEHQRSWRPALQSIPEVN